jgi:hypothetical protein
MGEEEIRLVRLCLELSWTAIEAPRKRRRRGACRGEVRRVDLKVALPVYLTITWSTTSCTRVPDVAVTVIV